MGEMTKLSAEELAALRQQVKSANSDNSRGSGEVVSSYDDSSKEFTIVVSEDQMSATLSLADPGEDNPYTPAEIMVELRKNKIIAGINSNAILQMVEEKIYDKPVEVAMGKPLLPPAEGYYEFLFDTEEHKTPSIREDGTADYSSVGRLENVKKGQKIAIYHPAVQGKNGYDINGRELVAKFAKELPPLRGMKIEKNEETNEYFAKIDGKISLKEFNIEILDVHEIKGDVTLIQGKIEFYGDLYITGDVENGVFIRVGRNVVVNGTVGAATIMAGGDIILSKGIQGAGRGRVSARGNIFSDFIEYASVESGLDVYANSIINSDVSSGGSVIVSGKHGSIIGGETHGFRGITANAAGSANEVRTLLHAGFVEEDYKLYTRLVKEEKERNKELTAVVEKITEILKVRAKNGYFSRDQKAIVISLKGKKEALCEEIKDIDSRKSEISRKMSGTNGVSIVIRGTIFRNVVIGIDVTQVHIDRDEIFVKYICKNGEIERRIVPY